MGGGPHARGAPDKEAGSGEDTHDASHASMVRAQLLVKAPNNAQPTPPPEQAPHMLLQTWLERRQYLALGKYSISPTGHPRWCPRRAATPGSARSRTGVLLRRAAPIPAGRVEVINLRSCRRRTCSRGATSRRRKGGRPVPTTLRPRRRRSSPASTRRREDANPPRLHGWAASCACVDLPQRIARNPSPQAPQQWPTGRKPQVRRPATPEARGRRRRWRPRRSVARLGPTRGPQAPRLPMPVFHGTARA